MPILSASNDTAVSTILNAAGTFNVLEAKLIKDAIISVAGGDRVEAYSAGTNYTLTTTLADMVFSIVSPTITIPRDGTYSLEWYAEVIGNAATTAPTNVLSLVLFNGATPLGMGGMNTNCQTMTTSSESIPAGRGAPHVLNLQAGNVITLRGRISPAPAAGTLECRKAVIVATRLY